MELQGNAAMHDDHDTDLDLIGRPSEMPDGRYGPGYVPRSKLSDYKLATDRLKERLSMLHKDRNSSARGIDENIGVLAKLLDMPMDIFCEISIYLEPYDLLNLARSTRVLNGFLMSYKSRPIWRMARTYYPGLPECPSDLSEPAYARLLFETDCCHACLEPRNTRPYFALRARLCYICCTTTVIKGYELMSKVSGLQGVFLQCVPCLVSPLLHRRPISQEEFYIERAEAITAKFYARYPEMRKEEDYFVRRKAYMEFIEENKISMETISKHVAEVDQWLVTYRQMKTMEANSAVLRHQLRLQNQLVEMGYSTEDFPGDWDAEWEDIMGNPLSFSAETSNSVIKTLQACIQREKERREADEADIRRSMRENEVMNFMPSLTIPSWMNRVDIFQLHTIQELLQQKNDFSIPITENNWKNARPRILHEIDSYTAEMQEKLFQLISPSTASTNILSPATAAIENLIATLNSPMTFFRCKCCLGSLLRYPMLLSHNSHSSTKVVVNQRLRFDPDATAIAKCLYDNLGCIQENLDEAKFECLRCAQNTIPPLSWDDLIYHFVAKQHEYRKANAKWHTRPYMQDLYDDHALTGPVPAAFLTKSQADVLSFKAVGKKLARVRLPF